MDVIPGEKFNIPDNEHVISYRTVHFGYRMLCRDTILIVEGKI